MRDRAFTVLISMAFASLMMVATAFAYSTWHTRDNNRFVPIAATNYAVETRTGQLCYTYDPLSHKGTDLVPLCKDLK